MCKHYGNPTQCYFMRMMPIFLHSNTRTGNQYRLNIINLKFVYLFGISVNRPPHTKCLSKGVNKKFVFPLMSLLPPRLIYLCCASPFLDADTCEKKLSCFHNINLNIGIK